ncbi:MAG TPA: DNA alkylation repair protein [Aggregatilineales bacterium]|nr:DNA alkylation repair protein [Anaerolineales bacterium]HRE49062.1 DNA alkylation repair protein [Aggregatilineales bacterium]
MSQPANPPLDYESIIAHLRAAYNPANVAGQRRFGITPQTTQLGISMVTLRALAAAIKRAKLPAQHALALRLWESGIHEGRILASVLADPNKLTSAEMDRWTESFDSWDICDQCCANLYVRTPHRQAKVEAWCERSKEFVKRAGFVLIAATATHDKKVPDSLFEHYLTLIRAKADDERNFVKKAINWALRGIGKRNRALNAKAIQTAEALLTDHPKGSSGAAKAARWVATDTLRELTSAKIQAALKR